MRRAVRAALAAVLGAGASALSLAAPLDALPDADPQHGGPGAAGGLRWRIEAAGDLANDRVDVLGLRSGSAYDGTRIGDYRGRHLRLGARHARGAFDAGLWQRRIEDRDTAHRLRSWQLGGQWRLDGRADADPGTRWALRLSAWGSGADELRRNTSAALVAGTLDSQLQSLRVREPRDRQTQLDLVASQPWRGGWSGHAALGLGRSRVDNQGVDGRTVMAGCPYDLEFGVERLLARPSAGCSNALTIAVPNALLPADPLAESRYSARLLHLAVALRLQREAWSAAVGLDLLRWQRDRVDAALAARGGRPLRDNQTLIGELQYALTPAWQLLLRGQLMQRQFLSELPLAYNSQSAGIFAHRYGLVSAGLVYTP